MVVSRWPALALPTVLAVGVLGVGCDGAEPERAIESAAASDRDADARGLAPRSALRAGDGQQVHSAAVDTPHGRFEFESLLEHHVTPDGDTPWVALLVGDVDDTWTGTLHVGRADAPEPVFDGVARGLRGCAARPRLWVFTRLRDDDPGRRGLWLHDGEAARERALPEVTLDRVAGLSPDCEWAVIVTRGAGLPVLQAVALAGDDAPVPLANHDLSYTPGTRPAGFVPPPTHNDVLRWDDARRFRYEVGEERITLELPATAGEGAR